MKHLIFIGRRTCNVECVGRSRGGDQSHRSRRHQGAVGAADPRFREADRAHGQGDVRIRLGDASIAWPRAKLSTSDRAAALR